MAYYSGNLDLENDWNAYWDTATPGSTRDWAGGTLRLDNSGKSSRYIDPTGKSTYFTRNTNPDYLAGQSPSIKDLWDSKYDTLGSNLDLETDANPSTSQSGTLGATSELIGGWLENLDQMLSPTSFDARASGIYDAERGKIKANYQDQMNLLPYLQREQLLPNLQTGINALANKGILDSSVSSDVLSQISRAAAGDILGKQYDLGTQEMNALNTLGAQEAQLRGSLPLLTAGAVQNIGGFSQSDSGNWQLLASLFPNLMEYGG